MFRRPRQSVVLAAVLLGAAGCGGGPKTGDLSGWNVLLITIDTLRADRLGFEGWDTAETPILDGLAERGVAFRTCVATAPVTLPSHASILTGHYPPRHGALDNGVYSLPDDVPTLATALRDAGYETAAVIGAYVLHRQYGLARGFDLYEDRFRRPRMTGDAHRERRAAMVAGLARKWLSSRRATKPFFLWTHFYDPHAPYDPPGAFARLTDPYDGEIAYTDMAVGDLLAELRRLGLLERTLVVVTADHGEGFGDGGEETHGLLLRESTLRVPLVFAAEGALPGGARPAGVASGADVTPTILDLLGVPVPRGLDGVALTGAMAVGEVAERIAYSSTELPRNEFGWSGLEGARDARWARVLGPIPELYDLEDDPGQRDNLAGTEPGVSGRLDGFLAGVRGAARPGRTRAMGAEEIEALRALGYVVSATAPEYTGADPKTKLAEWRRMNDALEAATRGDQARALAIADEVLRDDPGNYKVRAIRGEALVALGRADEGIEELRAVFEATGSMDHDGIALARALARAGRIDESERLLRRFIEAQPQSAEHLFNLGVLLSSAGRLPDARQAYEDAARRNPNGVHILTNLALTLARVGRDPERAVETIDRAVQLADGDDRPRLLRLDVLHLVGRDEEAMEGLRELEKRGRLRGVAPNELADIRRRLQVVGTGKASGG